MNEKIYYEILIDDEIFSMTDDKQEALTDARHFKLRHLNKEVILNELCLDGVTGDVIWGCQVEF